MFTEKVLATIVILLGGTLLTATRRWNNTDNNAGLGIAGWTIATVFLVWVA